MGPSTLFTQRIAVHQEVGEFRQKWKQHLTPEQQRRVEILDLFEWSRASRCGFDEIGCHEAHAIRGAVARSQLIRDAGCTHALKANGRWFAYGIESVLGMCNARQPWPVLVTQNPRWQYDPDDPDPHPTTQQHLLETRNTDNGISS